MANINTIKITQLQNIGANLNGNTLFPVVSTVGTNVTDKANLETIATFILDEAGNLLPQAYVSTFSQSVINAAQPNITSVGTLTSVSVNGNVNLPNISLVHIQGGNNGDFLQTNGNGVLNWSVAPGNAGNGSPGGANSQLQFNNSGVFAGDAALTWDAGNAQLNTVKLAASEATIYGNVAAVNATITTNLIANVGNFTSVLSNTISATGNITANYFVGNGSALTGITAVANAGGPNNSIQFNNNGAISGDTDLTYNSTTNTLTTANITATGTVTANYLAGDGSNISNINVSTANSANYANLSDYVVVTPVNNNFSYHVVLTTGAYDYSLHNDVDDNFQYNPADGILTVTRVDTDFVQAGNVISNLNPFLSNTYSLGSNTLRWKDLYLSNSTIYLGNATLSGNGNSVVASSLTLSDGNIGTIGNIASLTLDGSSSNVLYGNGVFAPGSGGNGSTSELVNGDNSFVLDNDGNVIFEGLAPGQGVDRGLVWDFGANANGLNSQVRQDYQGITVRAWTEQGGGANGYSAPVNIVTNQDATEKRWIFDGQGNLTLPGNLKFATGNIQSNEVAPAFNSGITSINSGNANVIITIAGEIFEGPVSGQVTISGVNPPLQANGDWWYQAVEVDQFQLFTDANLTTPVDGTTWPGYIDGGTAVGIGVYNDLTVQGGNVSVSSNDKTWTFDTNGDLNTPTNASSFSGRIITANGYPTLVAYGSGGHGGPELDWANTDSLTDLFDNNTVLRHTMYLNDSEGLYVGFNENTVAGEPKFFWNITPSGNIIFPTLDVDLHNGGVQSAQTLQFGDPTKQVVITGPTPDVDVNAQRIIIQGQRGNGTGEGGDVYVWAGDADTNGGDIKIYAGDADNVSTGSGGYINLDGGSGFNGGGQINITGGYSQGGQGGPTYLSGGQGATDGGAVTITGGGASANQGGNVGITGGYGGTNGGEVRLTGGSAGTGIPGYGNVVLVSGASSWTFDNGGVLTVPGAIAGNTLYLRGDAGESYTYLTLPNDADSNVNPVTLGNDNGNVQISAIDQGNATVYNWIFNNNGLLTLPDGAIIDTTGNNFEVRAVENTNFEANAVVNIYTDTSNNGWQWQFDDSGKLNLAGGGSIIESLANSSLDPTLPNVSTMVLTPDSNYTSQILVLDPTAPGHLHLRTFASSNIDQPNANLFLGGEETAFEVTSGSNNEARIHSGNNTWRFGNDGVLSFPRDATGNTDPYLVINGGTTPAISSVDASLAGPANLQIVSNYLNFTGYSGAAIAIHADNGEISGDNDIVIQSNVTGTTNSWTFDDTGNLTIPGNLFANNGASPAPVLSGFSSLQAIDNIKIGNLTFASNVGSNGQVLTTYGNGVTYWSSVSGGTPAGSNNQIQFNSNGAFGASANYKFTDTVGGGSVEVGNELLLLGNGTISTASNNLNIQPAGNLVVTASAYNWTFDIAGNLALPGNTFAINYANGSQASAPLVDVLNTNGLTTVFYPTFVENRTTGQIVRADVDLSYRTDTNTLTVGNISGNTNGYTLGYLNIPQVAASNTTLALTDAGKHYYSTTAGNLTLTIPLNSSVAFPTGTAVSIVVQAAGNVLVNAASGVTLYMAGSSTAGNRVVGTYGMATLMKVASDTWFINGTGVY